MNTQKFTKSQHVALSLLVSVDCADFYDLMRVGATGATMKKLVSLQMVSLIEARENGNGWKITQTGRIALSAGQYFISRAS
ncbi:MAG: hypothetical protein ACYC0M_10805 [Burkholderiales bacterium]